MKTVAATFHPIRAAACHGVRVHARPKAAIPAANATTTRVRAAPCEVPTLSGLIARRQPIHPVNDTPRASRARYHTVAGRYAGSMPFGRYTVLDDGEPVGTEEFRSAPGPMGWRSFSQVQTSDPSPHGETLDFAVDAGWRIARVRIDTGEHDLLLEPTPRSARR